MEDKIQKLKLHFFYCSVILVMIIIAIATDRWTLLPKFTEFLSNAATMTSLVLGLVAIFYSFIANDGLSKSLGSIGAVSEEIKSSKEQIVRQVASGAETTKAAERSAVLIDAASVSISSSLTSLSGTLAEIQSRTEILHGALVGLPTRLDQLETKVIDATRSLGKKPEEQTTSNRTKAIDASIIQTFLQKASLAANMLTYACVLAHKNKKEINFVEFCAAIDSKVENYYLGYIDAMDSIQIIKTSLISTSPRKYNIDDVNPVLISNTKDYIIGFLDRQYKTHNPEAYTRWTTAMSNIEVLYDIV